MLSAKLATLGNFLRLNFSFKFGFTQDGFKTELVCKISDTKDLF